MLYHTAFRRVINEACNIRRRFDFSFIFFFFSSFYTLPNTFLASLEIKIYFFFLVEESVYKVILSTHSYWILKI